MLIAALAPDGEVDQWQNIFYIGAAMAALGGLVWLFFGSNELADWAKVDQNSDTENSPRDSEQS